MDRACSELLGDQEERLVLKTARKSQGMTLIEIMIALAILGLLLGMGVPAFTAFLANSKVRSAAEGLQTGLTLARSEAMRRNQTVEFVLTNDEVNPGTVGTVTPAAGGIHWLVRAANPVSKVYELIEAKSGYEGSGQATGASAVQVAASDAMIAFRGLGGTQGLAAAATFDFSNPQAGACHTPTTPSAIRCLRVQVSVAGQIRVCDPSTTAPDTRAC
jgi:type IV fimbrial biogenesis protein FimT